MANFLTVSCTLALLAVAAASAGVPSQPPAEDCTTLIYNMMDCLSFLSSGSDETKPNGSCCLGFKTLVKADADCICIALGTAPSLGIDINMTRAEALSTACGVSSAFSISRCDESDTPGASPGNSPAGGPSKSANLGPTSQPPAATSAPIPEARAPSPIRSGAYTISATSLLLLSLSFISLFNALA